jgi:hypothetical protein
MEGRRSQGMSRRSRLQKLTQLSDYWLVIDVIHNQAHVVAGLPLLFVGLLRLFVALRSKSEIVIVI